MKTAKKLIAVALVLGVVICLFAGCGESKKIIGSWTCTNNDYVGAVFTFNEDGTGAVDGNLLGLTIDLGSLASVDMTYEIKGKEITVSYSVSVLGGLLNTGSDTEVYTMAFEGDNLTLTRADGTVLSFTKNA